MPIKDIHHLRNALTDQVNAIETGNRTPAMQGVMQNAAAEYASEVQPDKIKIVTDFPESTTPLAIFQNAKGEVEAAPIDPIVISYYEYKPSAEQEAVRRAANPGVRSEVQMSGALTLVDQVTDPATQISAEQLTAIQNLMGNNSTWWPIKDYSPEDFQDVFGALRLSVVSKDGVPLGIAHLDTAELEEHKSVKIMFIALDPAMHGQGVGKEVLNEMMTRAIDLGAEKVKLDTVHHRDVRSAPGTSKPTKGAAADVYEKAGFTLTGTEMLDPTDLPEGIKINQLNGPIEYINELDTLRRETYQAYGLDPEQTLAKVHEWAQAKERPTKIPAGAAVEVVKEVQPDISVQREGNLR